MSSNIKSKLFEEKIMPIYFRFIIFICFILSSYSISFSEDLTIDRQSVRVPEFAREKQDLVPYSELVGTQYNLIEVLFVYSPEILQQYLNLDILQQEVDQIVAKANQIFINSKLRLRVKSVALLPSPVNEINDAEAELHQAVNNFALQELRDEHQADLVSLLVSHTSDNKHCGMAFQLEAFNEYSEFYGYQIVSLNPICEDWVFAHELGHNLGANHDLVNAPNPGLFNYSYGYRFLNQGVELRTVMAFVPGGLIPYFSSPLLTYQGLNIGTENTDNVKTLKQSQNFVASYRGESVIEILPSVVLKNKLKSNSCKFTAELVDFSPENTVEFYSRIKNKVSILKNIIVDEQSRKFSVRRGTKTKFIKAVISDSVNTYESSEVKCKLLKEYR